VPNTHHNRDDLVKRAAARAYLGIPQRDFDGYVRRGVIRLAREGRETLVLWPDILRLQEELEKARSKPSSSAHALTPAQRIEQKAQQRFAIEQSEKARRKAAAEEELQIEALLTELRKQATVAPNN
jgi:uncharacterized membrane protein